MGLCDEVVLRKEGLFLSTSHISTNFCTKYIKLFIEFSKNYTRLMSFAAIYFILLIINCSLLCFLHLSYIIQSYACLTTDAIYFYV